MDGMILVRKEKDFTSRDVVNIASKILKTKKIGHTGTLDPLATGLMVLAVGKATKISNIVMCDEKEYIAEAILGMNTDTLDVTGIVLNDENVEIAKEKIEKVLASYQKTYMQEVPLYSAVKINGKKLYEYARDKEEIELPKKEITIKKLELLDVQYVDNKTVIKMKCLVSKGTYIRGLIRDIGISLNTYGCMKNLERTVVGKYLLDDACTLEELEQNKFQVITMKEVLTDFKQVEVQGEIEKRIINGQVLENIYDEDYVVFLKSDEVLAVYIRYLKDNTKIKPMVVFKNYL